MIGMPVGTNSVPWLTALSLINTVRACEREKIPLRIEGPVGCSVVTWARDIIAAKFLQSDCTHLFWVDSDMAWTPKEFLRLLAAACGPYTVIGASYALKKDPASVIINLPDPAHVSANGHGNVLVTSLALGFTVVKREVMEKLAATKPKLTVNGIDCPDMFRLDRRADGGALGEDIAFFEDVAALGFQPWLDPSVRVGHIGQKVFECDPINALGLDAYAVEEKA
jgi:hypothetical protein